MRSTTTQRTWAHFLKYLGLLILVLTPVLSAGFWLAQEGPNQGTQVSTPPRRPGVKVVPRDQAKVTPPAETLAPRSGSLIVLDEDGNRITPSSRKDLPSGLNLPSSRKTKLGYRVETTTDGFRRLVPNSPIRSFSQARIDENNKVVVDCFNGPENLVDLHQTTTRETREGANQ